MSHSEAPIELVPYDPTWPAMFESERAALGILLAPWLVGEIEHFGSTAVPGLLAKPVIDIMAPVASLEASWAAIDAVRTLEYLYYPYRPEAIHWFCKPSPAFRTHHLHLVPIGSVLWREVLAFRDALRADPALRDAYARLKSELASRFRNDREAYTDFKGPFIRAVLENL